MLQKLGLSCLGLSASVLSLTTWADAEDFKQLYRNEFAQIGQQQIGDVTIPAFDEDGNPIPPANELYPVCFNDFNVYIQQIEGIIEQVEDLDSNVIPVNAASLWDTREVPDDEVSRDLQNLADEYTAQQEAGLWPAVQRVPVTYAEISNSNCDYLPEFIQMKDFIANRNIELEDKADFSSWLALQRLIPLDPCVDVRGAFTNTANSLLAQITTQEQEKARLVFQLYEEFGTQEQTIEEFQEILEEAYRFARDNDVLPTQNPLQDTLPATTEECKAETDPIAADITSFADNLKDIEDFIDFPAQFLCQSISDELQELIDSGNTINDEAQLQINADLLDLLAIGASADPNASIENLRDSIELDFATNGNKDCDSGIQIPYTTIPASCSELETASLLTQLVDLKATTDESLCLRDFVRETLDGACSTAHLAIIDQLDAALSQRSSEQTAIITQLFFDFEFGNQGQMLDVFTDDQIENFNEVLANGEFVGQAPLQNAKPDVPEDCEEEVAALNDEIDLKAGQLKGLDDFIEYLPLKLCQDYDEQVQAVIDANADALTRPSANVASLIQQLSVLEMRSEESVQDFNDRIYNEFIGSAVNEVDPGFAMPQGEAPVLCTLLDPTTIETLQTLIDETTEALSYEEFLTDRVNELCGESAMIFVGLRDQTQQQLDEARNDKQRIYQDLYAQLAPEGAFLDDYIRALETDFEMARDSLTDRSAITVDIPDDVSSCEALLTPYQEEIEANLAALNDEIDCIAYTSTTVCEELRSTVQALLDENADLLPDLQARIDTVLDDLILIEGSELDRQSFDLELQPLFDIDEDRPTIESGIVLPSEQVPDTCAGVTSYNDLLLIQGISGRMLSYEKWLMNRLTEQCGESATQLEEINTDMQTRLREAQDDKSECLEEFFALFGLEGQSLEQYTTEWEVAFQAAVDAGEATQVAVDVQLPETADSCANFVEQITQTITASAESLGTTLSCNGFIVDSVCSTLADEVASLALAAAQESEAAADRVSAIITDILGIEGLTEDDRADLVVQLREEFDEDEERELVLSGLATPTAEEPEKCDSIDYSALSDQIAALDDLLSLERWLGDRRLAFCATTGISDFQDALDALDEAIAAAQVEKTDALQQLWQARGGDLEYEGEDEGLNVDSDGLTFVDFVLARNAAFDEIADEYESDFTYDLTLPEAHEQCRSLTDPLVEEINAKIAELKRCRDSAEFACSEVCSEFQAAADEIVAANDGVLAALAQDVVAEIGALEPVAALEDETTAQLAERLHAMYVGDVEAGDFAPIFPDFTTPTDGLPETCDGKADYSALTNLIAETTDALSFKQWLQDLIEELERQAIAEHQAELERLNELSEIEEERREELIQDLFEEFEIEDQTIEQFETFLEEEFDELQEEDLIDETEVETADIPVPAGSETLVEDLRDEIVEEADVVGEQIDFNNFAFQFVCDEICTDIEEVQVLAVDAIDAKEARLSEVMGQLFQIYAQDGETRITFETRMRDEYVAQRPDVTEQVTSYEGISLPIDAIPEGCATGTTKLDMLKQALNDLKDIGDFLDFLMPRIDESAMILLQCMEDKVALEAVINDNFSTWSMCINEKSRLLTQAFNDDEIREDDEEFGVFLNRIRAQYDELKDEGLVYIVDPEIMLADVDAGCPQDVHDQLWIADQFMEILEDSLSYKEWLKASFGGFCDTENFQALEASLAPQQEDAATAIDQMVQNLFEIKHIDGEEEETFSGRTRGEYEADADVEPVSVALEIPETSLSCGDDARDAHQSLVDTVAALDDDLTYISWLTDKLEECCQDLEEKYEGIKMIVDLRLPPVTERKEALEHALWVFKGLEGDEVLGTEDETLEEFTLRNREDYEATNPLVIPIMSLSTFIDVPELCPEDVRADAQMLLDLMAQINEDTSYNMWMTQRLAECSEEFEMSIDQMIEAARPAVLAANQDKTEKLRDLFTFAAIESETMEEFEMRIKAEFDAYLDESGAELLPTGIEVPIVPDLADDDTEEARQELLDLEQGLAYCLTFVDYIETEIFTPCELLMEAHEEQLASVQPMIDASRATQDELIESLQALKPEGEGKTAEEFAVLMGIDFLDDESVVPVSSEIEQLATPLVCQEDTQTAAQDLQDAIEDLDNNLTFERWLAGQNQECCWDLGLEFLNLRQDKEEERAEVEARNALLQDSIIEIEGGDVVDILASFQAALEAGEVTVVDDPTVATDVPEQCQGSTHDARQRLIDECDELNTQKTLENYLVDRLNMACLDQKDVVEALIAEMNPELERIGMEKDALFLQWAEMAGLEGAEAEAFRVMQQLEFNRLYNDGQLDVVESDFVIPALPDNCPEDVLATRADAIALKDQLDRQATLCDWLSDQLEKACADQVTLIEDLLRDNMNRIVVSNDQTEWILMELYALDPEGALTLDDFKLIQGEAFVDAALPLAETGVTLPAVPDGCSDEDKIARRDLERFLNNLGIALALENWLQDKLQVFCDATVVEIEGLTDGIQTRLDDTCGPATLELLQNLYDFELSKGHDDVGEDLGEFSILKRVDFERAQADLATEVLSTGVTIPSLQDHCDQESHDARDDLIEKELELEDCLTFNNWLLEQLQLTCSDCAMRFMMEIDDQTIVLQAAELRIVDQLDNLYLLEDPTVPSMDPMGEPEAEPVVDFSVRKFQEFAAEDVAPMLPDFVIVDVAEECHEDVKQLRQDLVDLKDDIGEAIAYEKWLKEMVKEALAETEDEYRQIIADRQADADAAAGEVVDSINMLKEFKKLEGETDEEFAARMKIAFDRAFDRGLIDPVDTGIVVPDLPTNAPPSTTGAKALLEKFDETLSYQLTWAQWLQIRLEDCCDDIIDEYAALKVEFEPVKEQAVSDVASLLTDLYTFEGEGLAMDNLQYALVKREQFNAAQASPDTAIDVVPSGMQIATPPDTCDDDTKLAQQECIDYSDDLSELLTYEAWLGDELKRACDALKAQMDLESVAGIDQLEAKQDVLAALLEDLQLLNENTAEGNIAFARRLRAEFEAENIPLMDSGVVIPTVPESCEEEVQDALSAIGDIKAQLDDCITFTDWLSTQRTEMCDAKQMKFQDAVENPPHTQMPGMSDPSGQTDMLVQQLFDLEGEEVSAPDVDIFGTALRMQFEGARADPDGDVQEISTGIVIDEIPMTCQESTQLSRAALEDFEQNLQDTKTYNQWLREELASAQALNEEECDELAAEYDQIMADNFPRIQESKDAQRDVKADAYVLKAEDGESEADFDSRLKREFLAFVPLPIDPEITYMEVPSTCQESTFEAQEALRNFINSLSVEITYEDWLRNELKQCCDEVIVEMTELADPDRLAATNSEKSQLLDDLMSLVGDEGESREDFEERVFLLLDEVEIPRVETGIEIPEIPASCETTNPTTQATLNRLVEYDQELGDCLTQMSLLEALLAEACVGPRAEMEELLLSEAPRIDEAQARQTEKLLDLYVFKGLHDETQEHFERRLRQVFDNYVTHRRKTGVVMPQFPESCDEGTNAVASDLNDLLGRIADEETYDSWLKANLDACCDDRLESIMDKLEIHMPELQDLQSTRDSMMQFLYEQDGLPEQSLESFIEEKDAEYADLLANDLVDMAGLTSIHHIVPEVPGSCDQEVIDAADALRVVAEGIEDLKAQVQWLRPQAEESCTALEPTLAAVLLNKGEPVEFTQDDIEGWLEECFEMEGLEGEDLVAFKARTRDAFAQMVNDGDIDLVDVMIDLPAVPEFCGAEIQMQGMEAEVHEYTVSVFQTIGPWLEGRIDAKCDENAADLDMIIEINGQAGIDAQQDVADELLATQTILGQDTEDLVTFSNRLSADFAGQQAPVAPVLPVFTDSCDPEDSARLPEAQQTVEDSLFAQDFAQYLSDQAISACQMFEQTAYTDMIDQDGLATAQDDKVQALADLQAVDPSSPEGETFLEFTARINAMYEEAAPATELSGIVVADYPAGCDSYDDTIDASRASLATFKDDMEECLTFEKYLADLMEAALDTSVCDDAIATLTGQAALLGDMTADAKAATQSKVDDFLDTMDTENVMMLSGDDYVAMTLEPQVAGLVADMTLIPATPAAPAAVLEAMCDQAALDAVTQAAQALADQQTLNDLIDLRVDQICSESLTSLLDLTTQASELATAKTGAASDQLATNFGVATMQGYTGMQTMYLAEQFAQYQQDRASGAFTQTERFPLPAMDVPEGFCSQEVYDAVDDYSIQRDEWNSQTGFEEWLRDDLSTTLGQVVREEISDLAAQVDTQVNDATADIDAEIMRIFGEDQANPAGQRFTSLEDARQQLLADYAVQGLPQDSMLMASVPEALADELGDQADELNIRISALNEQLGLVAFLEGQNIMAEDLCGIYKVMLTQLTVSAAAQETTVRGDLGLNNNNESEANFFNSMTLVEPAPAIPAGLVRPEGCDADAEEVEYISQASILDIAQQYASWCDANPGSIMDGLCGPQTTESA